MEDIQPPESVEFLRFAEAFQRYNESERRYIRQERLRRLVDAEATRRIGTFIDAFAEAMARVFPSKWRRLKNWVSRNILRRRSSRSREMGWIMCPLPRRQRLRNWLRRRFRRDGRTFTTCSLGEFEEALAGAQPGDVFVQDEQSSGIFMGTPMVVGTRISGEEEKPSPQITRGGWVEITK